MNPDPQSPAPNSIRKIQIANVVLWIQAEIVAILTRLGPNGFHRGHYASAARIVQEAVTAQTLPDFITTPAYDVLNALD